MKLHRLQLQAFGPFAHQQDIDFDALDASGLFLIHGATGAGKTSILDAICYAVYGAVPGSRAGLRDTIRSDHADPTLQPYVLIEFTAAGERLRIRRSPEWAAPKKRGAGTTRRPSTVSLEVFRDNQWTVQSTRMDEAAEIVTDHLGLGLNQFAQVVLLPQGEFATFLRSKPEDRGVLLSRLFDIERFSKAQAWLVERKRELTIQIRVFDATIAYQTERLTELLAELDLPADPDYEESSQLAESATVGRGDRDRTAPLATTALLLTIEKCRGLASENATVALIEAENAERDRDLARDAVHSGGNVTALQEQARKARATTAAYELRELERTREIESLQAAQRAAVVGPVVERHVATTRHTSDAVRDRDAAGTGVGALIGPTRRLECSADHEEFAAALESGTAALAGFPELQRRRVAAVEEVGRRQEHRDQSSTRHAAINDRVAQLVAAVELTREELDAQPENPDAVAHAERAGVSAEAALRTAEAVGAASAAVTDAQESAYDAASTFTSAEGSVIELRRRRLAGMVGELGAQLREGCGCPVCGSVEHPMIAAVADDSVTADLVEAAETEAARLRGIYTECESQLAAARSRLQERWATHRTALAALDGDLPDTASATSDLPDIDALTRGKVAAQGALTTAKSLRDRRNRSLQSWHEATASLVAAGHEQVEAEIEVEVATTRLQDAEQRLTQLDLDIARTYAAHADSCWCDRVDHDQLVSCHARLERAHRELQRSEVALDAATEAARLAADDLADALAAQGFATMADCERAVLDPDRSTRVQSAIAAEQAHRDRALGVLDQPQVIEAEQCAAPDMDDLKAAANAADHRRTVATQSVSSVSRGVRDLQAIETAVREAVAASAADRADLAVVGPLADVAVGTGDNVRRMRLTSYVLAARLETVTTLANERLLTMSDGRFTLEHTDDLAKGGARSGLGLRVLDSWTGRARDTSTLSGGEAFIASLALALGLGAAVLADSGGRPLESLFVDEGFGSLDEQTLDQVMSMLDGLRAGGRSVGIVSHVGELRDRIDSRVEVIKTETGSGVLVHAARGSVAV